MRGNRVLDAPSSARRADAWTRSPLGLDLNERVYWTAVLAAKRAGGGHLDRAAADSAVLLRMPVRGGSADTIARLRSRFGAMRMVRRKVMIFESFYALNDPMRVPDEVAICADGWMAIAYASPVGSNGGARMAAWRRPRKWAAEPLRSSSR